ncbi:MAG: metalloregulator ArsR/SmtB family transcription factor [Thermoplasmata archaeon]|nr:metalloregulator ArsR/SmtB family transcription factor [Thermoplasmata archaeon]
MVQELRQFWEENAETLGKMTRENLYGDFNLEHILRSLPIPSRQLKILDLGTGAGKIAVQASLLGHTAVGVDFSKEMIKQARLTAMHFHTRIMLVEDDAETLHFPTGLFDVVIAKDLLFCVDDASAAINRWKDILNPGGFLIIADGNYAFHYKNEWYMNRHEQILRRYGEDDMQMMLGPDIDGERLGLIVKDYYSNGVRRPNWELWFLPGIGFEDFTIKYRDVADTSILVRGKLIVIPCRYVVTACKKAPDQDRSRPETSEHPVYDVDDKVFSALGNKIRLHIIRILEIGDMNVMEISEQLGIPQNDVSYHLRILREADIIVSRNEGKNKVYRLQNPKHIYSLLNTLYLMRNGL